MNPTEQRMRIMMGFVFVISVLAGSQFEPGHMRLYATSDQCREEMLLIQAMNRVNQAAGSDRVLFGECRTL
jgi:hypothetical protein